MLHECAAGDVVAAELAGELRVLRVGRVLGVKGTTRRAFEPTGVIVDRLDPDTLRPVPFDARCEYEMGLLGLDVAVVERIASAEFMRGLRRSRVDDLRATSTAPDAESDGLDPLKRMHDDSNKSALFEWHRASYEGLPDVPF